MLIPKNTLLLLLSVVTQWCFIYHLSSLLPISYAWMAGGDGSGAYWSSKKTRTMKIMGTSYEEQYTEFSNTEPHGNQQPSLSSPSLIGTTNDQSSINNSDKDCNDRSLPKNDISSISKIDREMGFLQFISGPPYQSKAIPPLHQHQHQQYLHLYEGVSTSLDTLAFSNNNNNKNQDDNSSTISTRSVAIATGRSFLSASSYLESLSEKNNKFNDDDKYLRIEALVEEKEENVTNANDNRLSYNEENKFNNENFFVAATRPNSTTITSTSPGMEIEDAADSTILDDSASTIEVRVETTFTPGITVERAKYGWLNFCWANGGGIMITTNTGDNAKKGKNEGYSSYDEVDDGVPRVRNLMVPIGMKQEIVSIKTSTEDENSNDDKTILRRDIVSYRTTQRGLFCRDFIQYSHKGSVEFIEILLPDSSLPSSSSSSSATITQMIWTVRFQIKLDDESINMDRAVNTPKEKFWAYWSQFQLKIASQNLLAYLDTSTNPVFIEHVEKMPIGVSPREAMEKWYDYYWCRGGGGSTLFVPPFLQQNNKKRWIVPSALEEEIISVEYNSNGNSKSKNNNNDSNTDTEIAEAIYKVNNPNLLTYPVYYHRAKVRFVRDKTADENKPTQLIWNVEVRPYRKSLGRGVQFMTKKSISYASRNLRRYLEEQQLQTDEQRSRQQQKQHREMRSYLEPTTSISSEGVTSRSVVEDENAVMTPPPDVVSGDKFTLPDPPSHGINNANIATDKPSTADKDETFWQ